MALRYAGGPYEEDTAIASSAFSKGDLLVLDSNSSLSRIDTPGYTLPIAGVALAASDESRSDSQVPYIVANTDTLFWSDATTGSQMTPGEELDFQYLSNDFQVTTSTNSVRAVVAQKGGTQDRIGQSDRSEVMVRLIDAVEGFLEYV